MLLARACLVMVALFSIPFIRITLVRVWGSTAVLSYGLVTSCFQLMGCSSMGVPFSSNGLNAVMFLLPTVGSAHLT